jgi:nitroimidazol reductase NimA-like FMN-containing flavoprotein (pyridoxamine 5'-phosphate oxidase superfamily)
VSAGKLQELSPDQCEQLLRGSPIGRVVFNDARGPVALPVNYAVDRGDIVFRTESFSSIMGAAYVQRVGFEVDAIDPERHEGWSVLATGDVRVVDDPAELRHVESLGVTPWAEGARTRYLRLRVQTISGRRITQGESTAAR